MAAAADRWRAELAAWALPKALLDAAPEDPYRPPEGLLARTGMDPPTTPTGALVTEALGDHGLLLDVGCGPGGWSASFLGAETGHARHHVVGVERNADLAAAARRRGLHVADGEWPEANAKVPVADVVTCTHVLYDVAEATPFLRALHTHARRLVAIEVTAAHPWAWLGPLYRHFHDLERPTGPTADDLVALVREAVGVDPLVARWQAPGAHYATLAELVVHRRRQLCLGPEHDAELARLLATPERGDAATRDLVTLWWRPAGA